MLHQSLWRDFQTPRFATSLSSTKFDVVIVGGGIFGLTAAYLLKQSGRRVCVLEKERIGSGQTGNTSAHLTCVTDEPLSVLSRRFGESEAVSVWRAGLDSIDLIERILRERKIDCDFARVPGFQFGALQEHDDQSDGIAAESSFVASKGFDAKFIASGPNQGRPAMRLENQAQFHPLKYLAGLAQTVHGDGSVVCEQCEVTAFSDDPFTLELSDKQRIECPYVVIATHVPLTGNANMLGATLFQTKLFLYSSYVLSARILSNAPEAGLYSDTSDPYFYLRVHESAGNRYAVFGGNDRKTGQERSSVDLHADLAAVFTRLFPESSIEHQWSGQVIETADGLPYIGEAATNQFVATGFSGNGLTFGTIAAQMARDAATGVKHPLAHLLRPDRKALATGLKNVVSENIDYPIHLVADRLRAHTRHNPDELKAGEGDVFYIDGQQVACHRDDHNRLHMVSATCTHLGCVVKWNAAERTWDCPCHGSRFASDGKLMGGPAETSLRQFHRGKHE